MVAKRVETLGQLQRRRGRIDPAGDDDAQQQFGQREDLAGEDCGRPLVEGKNHSRAEQRQQLQDRQQRQRRLFEPQDLAEAAHHRITTKVAMTAIIR